MAALNATNRAYELRLSCGRLDF
ncbi:hypothetical protein CCACVL1_13315 [Corchorus capsularis]|uniref:Uncharacterized protein n=1 Tax=Corchorus capsularis TaxID=210143 RepID=A0A1R3IBD2_COCAP|nr:hypothetical protein CCACVL1_13315 [Corchorus capsularis]